MFKSMWMIIMLCMSISVAQAGSLTDLFASDADKTEAAIPSDDAILLTLESKQSEMYPRVSNDGKYMLVNVQEKKQITRLSRRLIENGDELNVITDDERALNSARFSGDYITFLSERAGNLGMWKKAADGLGMIRRVKELQGYLTQVILLPNDEVIAVRLEMDGKKKSKASKQQAFNNWNISGYRSFIVKIDAEGHETRLSEGFHPVLSPNGKWIVFSMMAGRSAHLFMMHPDGSELAQLTDARSVDVQPTWSPDGKWIVFTSNRSHVDRSSSKHAWDIWAVDREGRRLTQLTKDLARDGAPNVSIDYKVYFHSDRRINKELKAERHIKNTGAYHIWSIDLPK